jgi:uncharacterized linocin/CFP29 family protein
MNGAHPHMNGRENVPGWSDEVWRRLDAAVHEELTRARVAAKFLPAVEVHAKTLTVPSDTVDPLLVPPSPSAAGNPGKPQMLLTVDEGTTTRINEFWVEFRLTPAQVEHEAMEEAAMDRGHAASTGITLATRAANILAQAEDTVIFQGNNALQSPLFTGTSPVFHRGDPSDLGLLNIVLDGTQPRLNPSQIIAVDPAGGPAGAAYQGNTVGAVARAFSALQANGQYGPYALVLQTVPYADAFTPLPGTMILPAAPIKELVTAGFFGTGTLPPWTLPTGTAPAPLGLPPPPPLPTGSTTTQGPVLYTGLLVSIGGNTMDIVRARLHHEHDAVVVFEQKDLDGNYRFRIVERFALRLKDPTAVALLEFMTS